MRVTRSATKRDREDKEDRKITAFENIRRVTAFAVLLSSAVVTQVVTQVVTAFSPRKDSKPDTDEAAAVKSAAINTEDIARAKAQDDIKLPGFKDPKPFIEVRTVLNGALTDPTKLHGVGAEGLSGSVTATGQLIVLQHLNMPKGSVFMDAGAGNGNLLVAAAFLWGVVTFGIEVCTAKVQQSTLFLEAAFRKVSEAGMCSVSTIACMPYIIAESFATLTLVPSLVASVTHLVSYCKGIPQDDMVMLGYAFAFALDLKVIAIITYGNCDVIQMLKAFGFDMVIPVRGGSPVIGRRLTLRCSIPGLIMAGSGHAETAYIVDCELSEEFAAASKTAARAKAAKAVGTKPIMPRPPTVPKAAKTHT